MENIEELLTLCRKWAGRENEVPVIDALTRLTEFYMSQCGRIQKIRPRFFPSGWPPSAHL